MPEEIEIEIVFDEESGGVFLSRDHDVSGDIASLINPEDTEFKKFLSERPRNVDDENRRVFCG